MNELVHGDSYKLIKEIPDESIDLICTDPPYGLKFMGKAWDKAVPPIFFWKECLRVLKPGAFAFVMCIPRQDCLARMIINLEDAGFKTGFTSIYYTFASGFPKATNISKEIQKRFLQVSLQDVSHSLYTNEDSQSDYLQYCRLCGELLLDGLVIFRDVSPLLNDVPGYTHPSEPSIEILVDNECKYKVSFSDVSFHHATPDLKPLSSWLTIASCVHQSKISDWLERFSFDNWGLGDKSLLLHDFDQHDNIEENNNVSSVYDCSVLSMPDKSEKVFDNIHKLNQSYVYHNKYCITCQEQMSSKYEKMIGSYASAQFKPAVEIVLVVMKPLDCKTYVEQALKNGKGITWFDEGMIPVEWQNDPNFRKNWKKHQHKTKAYESNSYHESKTEWDTEMFQQGRFPANLLVSDDILNDGVNHNGGYRKNPSTIQNSSNVYSNLKNVGYVCGERGFADSGSYSRYFDLDAWFAERLKQLPESVQKTFPWLIVPKPCKREKNQGCEEIESKEWGQDSLSAGIDRRNNSHENQAKKTKYKPHNNHPTVKPLKLFTYLITIGSRPGDVVLDPFVGSGTTALACHALNRNFLCVEKEEEFYDIAIARLAKAQQQMILL